MAANTDNFSKAYQNFSTTVASGGVTSPTSTTVPLTSVTGLPTDTAVIVTINRIDSSGTVTNNSETTIGVLSGTNLVNCVRGLEGTASAWGSGTVVEVLMTALHWNKLISGILVEHNQDGTHSKVNGNTVPSGTDTVALLTASQTLTNKTLTSPTLQTSFITKGVYNAGNTGTTLTISAANGDRQTCTLTGNCTFTWSNFAAGSLVKLYINEDATGGRTVTLPTGKWPGGAAGTFTTTASAKNTLIVDYDGTDYMYQLAAGFA